MIKIMGCAMLVFVSVSCAFAYLSGLRKRAKGLEYFINLLEGFKIKMQYELCTVPKFLETYINQDENTDFAQLCLEKLKEGHSLPDAWNIASQKVCTNQCMEEADIEILKQFSSRLGRTDLEGQISNITLHIELLNKNLVQAEENIKDKSRVAINTGVFAGVIVSILLI